MKKIILSFVVLIFAVNCWSQSLPENASISEHGFLIFPNVNDLESYLNSFEGKTHSEVKAYLADKGFSSLGATIYDEDDYGSQIVSEDQVINYLFDQYRIFQVNGVIMKPIEETDCITLKWQFLLTMTTDNLNGESLENLMSGTYDSNTMNKFTNNPSTQTMPLFDFIKATPNGYEESEVGSCPSDSDVANRRFLGIGWTNTGKHEWNQSAPGCGCGGWATTTYYTIFWQQVGSGHDDYICALCVN